MPTNPKLGIMAKNAIRLQRNDTDIIACAINNDFTGVDRALIDDLAVINAQWADSGITALMAASGRGLDQMVSHLLSKPHINIALIDDFGKDALQHARPFPKVVSILMRYSHPNLKWKEPGIFPL